MPVKSNYTPLSSKPDREHYADDECIYSETSTRTAPYRHWNLHWVIHAVNLAIITLMVIVLHKIDPSEHRKQCWDIHNYYSPINEAVNTQPFIETRFNGSLWHYSPFKGPPTPKVEETWHSVMANGMIAVTAQDLLRAGRDKPLSTAAQFPPPSKGNSTSSTEEEREEEEEEEEGGRYIAVALGTHQLHCLHYIWQDHHSSYFPDSVVRKKMQVPEMYERHYEHCIDFIRQSLMCHFDATLVTYDWVLDHQSPTPNGNVMHKCVNWDVLQTWLGERAVEVPDGFEWSQPEGQESLSWNP